MTPELVAIIVAVLSLIGNLVGSLVGYVKSKNLITYRIQALEDKLKNLGDFQERLAVVESQVRLLNDYMTVMKGGDK